MKTLRLRKAHIDPLKKAGFLGGEPRMCFKWGKLPLRASPKCQHHPWHVELWFRQNCLVGQKCSGWSLSRTSQAKFGFWPNTFGLTEGLMWPRISMCLAHTQMLILTQRGSDFHSGVGFPPWQAPAPQFVSRENILKVKFHSLALARKRFIGFYE